MFVRVDSGDLACDGYQESSTNTDCADNDPARNGQQVEITCNGIDDDCNGLTDDDPDADNDGYFCVDDCDDTDPAINPLATEVPCDGDDCAIDWDVLQGASGER